MPCRIVLFSCSRHAVDHLAVSCRAVALFLKLLVLPYRAVPLLSSCRFSRLVVARRVVPCRCSRLAVARLAVSLHAVALVFPLTCLAVALVLHLIVVMPDVALVLPLIILPCRAVPLL